MSDFYSQIHAELVRANTALPADDPRKFTGEDVEAVEWERQGAAHHGDAECEERLARVVAKIRALLPLVP